MKNFILGAISAIAIVACLAASEGGFQVAWKLESKRPSFQRAVAEYVRTNCQQYMGPAQRKQLFQDLSATDDRGMWLQPINCQFDYTKAEQGQ